ncbi:hypothetical protein RB601_006512 [Gaeumannomyces tritici]
MAAPITSAEIGGAALLKPGERDYERAVATENLLYRFSRPLCVVQPRNVKQVQAIINEARVKKLRVTIKNGGHSYAGSSTADGGILLDLLRMNKVKLDMAPGSRTPEFVTLEGGAKWGHAYKELVNGRHDGYVINGGRCPTVGVSGFILGGGLSPFTRSFGMGCDTLVEATIVTANGKVTTVKESDKNNSNERKLFWALCGAGGGNFGVVVSLKMKVQRLAGKQVVAGRFTWLPKPDADAMEKLMDTMRSFYTAKWPNSTTVDSTWICDLDQTGSEVGIRFLVYHDGEKTDFDKTIDKYIKDKELAKLMKRRTMAEKSSRFLHETLVEQWSEEIAMALPSADRFYRIYTSFVLNNNRSTINDATKSIRKSMGDFRKQFVGEKGLLQVAWIHSGGEANKKKANATAFPWRSCIYHTYIMLQWKDKWLGEDMKRFLKEMEKDLRPLSIDGRAAFINFPNRELRRDAHEAAYYGDNREELRRVKQTWDRDNFFSWRQGVRLPTKKRGAAGTGRARNMPMAAMPPGMEVMDAMAPAPGTEGVYVETDESEDEELATVDAAETEEREWDRFGVPLKNDFEGGIHSLADLGF